MEKRDPKDYLNLYRSEAQNHLRTQQSIKKEKTNKKEKVTALNEIKDFLSINIFGWVSNYIKSRLGKKHPFMDYSAAASNGVFEMYSEESPDKNKIKIVIAADWATYTEESKKIGELMNDEKSDYAIHLGDTYFVGAPPEIVSNFIMKEGGWPEGKSGSLALPGNHEFYSNGNPYFDTLLPTMFVKTKTNIKKQEASFFCLENDYWRVLGLDTGYYSVGRLFIELLIRPDAHLDNKLINWLKTEVQLDKDKKGLVILSHHQYCSAFEKQFTSAAEVLRTVLGNDRKVIWIWGHEHRFAVYGKYQSKNGIKAFGRCIGNGGMPAEIGKIKSGEESYKTPDSKQAKESNLVFYDNRKKEIIGKTIVGHNGYIVLNFDGNKLGIEYKDEASWLYREEWEADLQSGDVIGKKAENNPAIALIKVAGSFDDAIK